MGVQTGILGAMKDHRKAISGPHFLMSAENPKYPQMNSLKMDHAAVLTHLKGAGYDAHEVQGHYGGAPEKSIAIYGISPQHAEQLHGLASKLGQDSSIFSTGQKHEMRFHHGEDAGKKVMGQGTTWHSQRPADGFTSLPGGSSHFTHNFDFDKPIMPAKKMAKSEQGIYSPVMQIPSDAKIVLDQANSPPGAIELMFMKYPDHVIIEKDKDATDACYIVCHKEEVEKWSMEMANYGIQALGIEIDDHDHRANPGAEGEGQMGFQRSPEGTINNQMLEKKEKIGTGVPNEYRKKAKTGGDVLFKVHIKGRDHLTKDIPLHMSLKVFDEKQKMDLEDIKAKVKELGVKKPDPSKLKFRTKIHYSEASDTDYFMLMVDGCDASYKKFYDSMDGVQYNTYFMHVTIDKQLYDEINKDGLEPHEIKFDNLSVEKGAGNTIYEFEDNSLEKSFKAKAAGAMIAASSMISQPSAPKAVDMKPPVMAAQKPAYNPDHMLKTIASVESSSGKNTQHDRLKSGEQAYGKYALTPNVIRETINLHPELRNKYKKATILRGEQLQHYMKDNPTLEDSVARQHLKRLEKHFGQDPQKIGYAWLEGIRGTYKAQQRKQDISKHWHVLKINDAYNQGDKK
jgi:hypothetical protein